jgi:hypothetical protein
MMPAALRRLPPVVSTFLIFTVITFAVGLARSTKLWHHPIAGVIVVALIALWIAAIVVWRQRWAWALWVLLVLSALLSPGWGERNGVLVYLSNLVTLALLASPGMRRWVGVNRRRNRPATSQP